jgi:hypothetical protein
MLNERLLAFQAIITKALKQKAAADFGSRFLFVLVKERLSCIS